MRLAPPGGPGALSGLPDRQTNVELVIFLLSFHDYWRSIVDPPTASFFVVPSAERPPCFQTLARVALVRRWQCKLESFFSIG